MRYGCYKQRRKGIYNDIQVKSYASASPKIGNVYLKGAFNKMRRRARRSSEAYQKYLGKYVGKLTSVFYAVLVKT